MTQFYHHRITATHTAVIKEHEGGLLDGQTPLLYVSSSFLTTSLGCLSYSSTKKLTICKYLLNYLNNFHTHFFRCFSVVLWNFSPYYKFSCSSYWPYRGMYRPIKCWRWCSQWFYCSVVLICIRCTTYFKHYFHIVCRTSTAYSSVKVIFGRSCCWEK